MTKHDIVKNEITFLLSPKVPSGLSLRLRVNTLRCIWLIDRLIDECMRWGEERGLSSLVSPMVGWLEFIAITILCLNCKAFVMFEI